MDLKRPLNFNKLQAKNLIADRNAGFPSSPIEGQVAYNNALQCLCTYNGTLWIPNGKNAAATLTSASGSVAVDARLGSLYRHTLTEGTTFANPTNAYDGQEFTFYIKQAASGGPYFWSLGNKFYIPAGLYIPWASNTASAIDVFKFIYDATADVFRMTGYQRADGPPQFYTAIAVGSPNTATVAPYFTNRFFVPIDHSFTLANTGGLYHGQEICIQMQQNATGSFVMTLGSGWTAGAAVGWSAPVLTPDAYSDNWLYATWRSDHSDWYITRFITPVW